MQMTIKYWNSLSNASKQRAIDAAFPHMRGALSYMVKEKPDMKQFMWKALFGLVKIPKDNSHYKTVVGGWHMC